MAGKKNALHKYEFNDFTVYKKLKKNTVKEIHLSGSFSISKTLYMLFLSLTIGCTDRYKSYSSTSYKRRREM